MAMNHHLTLMLDVFILDRSYYTGSFNILNYINSYIRIKFDLALFNG